MTPGPYSVLHKESLADPVWHKLTDVEAGDATRIETVMDSINAEATVMWSLNHSLNQ